MEQVEMADPLDAQVIRREDQARLARAGVIDKCTLHGRRGSVGIIACRDREQWAAKCREAAQHFRPFSGRETVFDTCAPESPFVGDARRQVLEPSKLTAGEIAQHRGKCRHRNVPLNDVARSEEHTSELQSLMRISYAVFCLKKKNNK